MSVQASIQILLITLMVVICLAVSHTNTCLKSLFLLIPDRIFLNTQELSCCTCESSQFSPSLPQKYYQTQSIGIKAIANRLFTPYIAQI